MCMALAILLSAILCVCIGSQAIKRQWQQQRQHRKIKRERIIFLFIFAGVYLLLHTIFSFKMRIPSCHIGCLCCTTREPSVFTLACFSFSYASFFAYFPKLAFSKLHLILIFGKTDGNSYDPTKHIFDSHNPHMHWTCSTLDVVFFSLCILLISWVVWVNFYCKMYVFETLFLSSVCECVPFLPKLFKCENDRFFVCARLFIQNLYLKKAIYLCAECRRCGYETVKKKATTILFAYIFDERNGKICYFHHRESNWKCKK